MYNWILEKDVIIRETIDDVVEGLECLLEGCTQGECASYSLSSKHSIYAEIVTDSSEMWIDIKLEIYDKDGDWVGDLAVADTKDMSRESLEKAVTEIIKYYYGEV